MTLYILLGILLFLSFANLVLLVALGAFVVQMRQRSTAMFSDLVDMLDELFGTIPAAPSMDVMSNEKKTWDEKYEEDLEALQRRIRAESGLKDLPDPTLSWGEPPAPSPQEGLTIKDK